MKRDWTARAEEALALLAAFALPFAVYAKAYDIALIKAVSFHVLAAGLAFAALLKVLEVGRLELPERSSQVLLAPLVLFAGLAVSGLARGTAFAAAEASAPWLLYIIAAVSLAGLGPAARVADGIAAAGALTGAYAVLARLGFDPFALGPAGPLGAPAMAGAFLAAAFAVAAGRGGLHTSAAVVALAGVVAVGSPVGFLALAAGGAAVFVFHGFVSPLARRRAAAAGLFAVAAAVLAFRLAGPGETVALGQASLLKATWAGAGAMLLQKPIGGWGVGNFAAAFASVVGRQAGSAHPLNELLAMGCDIGLGGVLLWLDWAVLLLLTAYLGLRRAVKEGVPGEAGLLAALASGWTALFAASFVSGAAREAVPGAAFALLGGLLAGLSLQRAASGKVFAVPVPLPSAARRALAVPAAAALAALLAWELGVMGSDVRHNLGIYHARRGEWNAALSDLDAVVVSAPAHLRALYARANILLDRGERGDAEKSAAEFERLQAFSADYGQSHYRMGLALAKSGEWGRAIEEHRRQAVLDPADADNWRELARALETQGEREEAWHAGLVFLSLRTNDPEPWKELAQRYRARGDRRTARLMFQRAERVRAVAQAAALKKAG